MSDRKNAPERIQVITSAGCGPYIIGPDDPLIKLSTEYVRADIAEAQAEELRAEVQNLKVKLQWAESREQNAVSRELVKSRAIARALRHLVGEQGFGVNAAREALETLADTEQEGDDA